MHSLQSSAISQEIAARRLSLIKKQMHDIAGLEQPYESMLQIISRLSKCSFNPPPSNKIVWTAKTVRLTEKGCSEKKGTYFVSHTSATIEVILPLFQNHCKSTGIRAYKILFDANNLESVVVKPILAITGISISHPNKKKRDDIDKFVIEEF